MKMIILHKIKFYTEINQFSLYLLYIPVHDLNTLYTMMCLLNAPISIRMLIVNIYNEVSCTQSLDHKLVQTMHSSFTITSLSLLKELSLSSTSPVQQCHKHNGCCTTQTFTSSTSLHAERRSWDDRPVHMSPPPLYR